VHDLSPVLSWRREIEMKKLRKFWFDNWQWIIATTLTALTLLTKIILG
jgi:hypothetical protein